VDFATVPVSRRALTPAGLRRCKPAQSPKSPAPIRGQLSGRGGSASSSRRARTRTSFDAHGDDARRRPGGLLIRRRRTRSDPSCPTNRAIGIRFARGAGRGAPMAGVWRARRRARARAPRSRRRPEARSRTSRRERRARDRAELSSSSRSRIAWETERRASRPPVVSAAEVARHVMGGADGRAAHVGSR